MCRAAATPPQVAKAAGARRVRLLACSLPESPGLELSLKCQLSSGHPSVSPVPSCVADGGTPDQWGAPWSESYRFLATCGHDKPHFKTKTSSHVETGLYSSLLWPAFARRCFACRANGTYSDFFDSRPSYRGSPWTPRGNDAAEWYRRYAWAVSVCPWHTHVLISTCASASFSASASASGSSQPRWHEKADRDPPRETGLGMAALVPRADASGDLVDADLAPECEVTRMKSHTGLSAYPEHRLACRPSRDQSATHLPSLARRLSGFVGAFCRPCIWASNV